MQQLVVGRQDWQQSQFAMLFEQALRFTLELRFLQLQSESGRAQIQLIEQRAELTRFTILEQAEFTELVVPVQPAELVELTQPAKLLVLMLLVTSELATPIELFGTSRQYCQL